MIKTPENLINPFDPALLLRSAAFPHKTTSLELLETHISWVILTGNHAYKIKKPVHLPFVDYSTLERRKHFCEFELELNRELAPDIYLDVVRITGPVSAPEINGTGDVLEYAVRMNEFEQSDILTHRLENGAVTPADIDRLARIIANFHENTMCSSAKAPFGGPDRVLEEAEDNFSAFMIANHNEKQADSEWSSSLSRQQREQLNRLRDWTLTEFKRCESLLIRRHSNGMIRRCHGDMHANNIVLFQGRIEIFDRIEFNQDFQWIDCMNELAFPVMDLIHHQRNDLANRLLSGYLERTGDYEGLGVFRFYLVYRSMVRAKVDWIRQQQTIQAGISDATGFKTDFLDLALKLSQPLNPFLYITHGLSGSGKSTASMICVESTGAIRIRSDVERKRVNENQSRSVIFTPEMRSKVYVSMLKTADYILESGFPVIVDATFLDFRERQKFHELAKQRGIPFGIIECNVAIPELERRIRERMGDASDATVDVLHVQLKTQDPLTREELKWILRPIVISRSGDLTPNKLDLFSHEKSSLQQLDGSN